MYKKTLLASLVLVVLSLFLFILYMFSYAEPLENDLKLLSTETFRKTSTPISTPTKPREQEHIEIFKNQEDDNQIFSENDHTPNPEEPNPETSNSSRPIFLIPVKDDLKPQKECKIKITDTAHRAVQVERIAIYDIFTHESHLLEAKSNGELNVETFQEINQYFFIIIEHPHYETKIGFINFFKTDNLLITLDLLSFRKRTQMQNKFVQRRQRLVLPIDVFLLDSFEKNSHFIYPEITTINQTFLFDLLYESLPKEAKKEIIKKDLSIVDYKPLSEPEAVLHYQLTSQEFSTNILPMQTAEKMARIQQRSSRRHLSYAFKDFHDLTDIRSGEVTPMYSFQQEAVYKLGSGATQKFLISDDQPVEDFLSEHISLKIPHYKNEILSHNIQSNQATFFIAKSASLTMHIQDLNRFKMADSITFLKSSSEVRAFKNIENATQIFDNLSGRFELFTYSENFKDFLHHTSFVAYSGQTLDKKFPEDFIKPLESLYKIKFDVEGKPLFHYPIHIVEGQTKTLLQTDHNGVLHLYEPLGADFKISLTLKTNDKQEQKSLLKITPEDFTNNVAEISFDRLKTIRIENLDRIRRPQNWSLQSMDGSISISSDHIFQQLHYYTHKKVECILLLNKDRNYPQVLSRSLMIGGDNLVCDADALKPIEQVKIPFKIESSVDIENGIAIVDNLYKQTRVRITNNTFELPLQSNSFNKITIHSKNHCHESFILIPDNSKNQDLRLITLEKSMCVEITSLSNQHWNIASRFQVGDKILQYNNQTIYFVDQFKSIENQGQPTDTISLTIKRNNMLLDIELPFTRFQHLANHK